MSLVGIIRFRIGVSDHEIWKPLLPALPIVLQMLMPESRSVKFKEVGRIKKKLGDLP